MGAHVQYSWLQIIEAWGIILAIFVGIPAGFILFGAWAMKRDWLITGALIILFGIGLGWVGYEIMFNVKGR